MLDFASALDEFFARKSPKAKRRPLFKRKVTRIEITTGPGVGVLTIRTRPRRGLSIKLKFPATMAGVFAKSGYVFDLYRAGSDLLVKITETGVLRINWTDPLTSRLSRSYTEELTQDDFDFPDPIIGYSGEEITKVLFRLDPLGSSENCFKIRFVDSQEEREIEQITIDKVKQSL